MILKEKKTSPKIVYRCGVQDNAIKEFLSIRIYQKFSSKQMKKLPVIMNNVSPTRSDPPSHVSVNA